MTEGSARSIAAVTLRLASVAHLLSRWEHERTTARWSRAQAGGPSVIPVGDIHYKLRRLLT